MMDDILGKISEMRPPLRLCSIEKTEDATCGFHLSRTQWDPYPWISNVDENSPAASSGLTIGDFVIEVNGEDILGLRIDEVAQKVRLKSDAVRLLVWKSTIAETENKLPAAFNMQKFSGFLQSTLQLIECPVCLDITSVPTFQCFNGHILCSGCRQKTTKCPMCRVPLSGKGRCLIAEKLHRLVRKTLSVKCPQQSSIDSSKKTVDLCGRFSERKEGKYHCPWNENCSELLVDEKGVLKHIHGKHAGPYIQYSVAGDTLSVHLPDSPCAIGINTQYSHIFFFRVSKNRECWLNVLGNYETAKQYNFCLKIGNLDCEYDCGVISLQDSSESTIKKGLFLKLPPNETIFKLWIRKRSLKDT